VLCHRLDRLGRKLTVILDAHDQLADAGVAIRSATEPFDTSTAFGKAMFQFLGVIAELEKSTIAERTTLGRQRMARTGVWSGGPVPFGYEIDAERRLTPSARPVGDTALTEAELVLSLFERIASGSTTMAESRRFTEVGADRSRRYANGTVAAHSEKWHPAAHWAPSVISNMVRNATYKGLHTITTKAGTIDQDVVPLVPPDLWQRACDQLIRNRNLSLAPAAEPYLLRGLVVCETCGRTFVGHRVTTRGVPLRYYACGGGSTTTYPDPSTRCRAKQIRAEWLDALIWQDCRAFILEPGKALDEARARMREKFEQSARLESEREQIAHRIATKEAERERVTTLFRRGLIDLDEAAVQLDALKDELATLRLEEAGLANETELLADYERKFVEAQSMLVRLGDNLAGIEAENDLDAKRRIVEYLVDQVRITTTGTARAKQASVTAVYTFGGLSEAVTSTGR
jgi:site-specific DNA recombinase